MTITGTVYRVGPRALAFCHGSGRTYLQIRLVCPWDFVSQSLLYQSFHFSVFHCLRHCASTLSGYREFNDVSKTIGHHVTHRMSRQDIHPCTLTDTCLCRDSSNVMVLGLSPLCTRVNTPRVYRHTHSPLVRLGSAVLAARQQAIDPFVPSLVDRNPSTRITMASTPDGKPSGKLSLAFFKCDSLEKESIEQHGEYQGRTAIH